MFKFLSHIFAHQDTASPASETALVNAALAIAPTLVSGPAAPLLTNLFAALFIHGTAPSSTSQAAVAEQAIAHLPQLLQAAGVPVAPK